jgi:NCAIR mutase (PurE)-related protein
LTVISSNSVAEGGAQVVVAKEAMTWKSVVGLTVVTIDDPGVKKTIRAFEVGQIQITNPDAICKITGV